MYLYKSASAAANFWPLVLTTCFYKTAAATQQTPNWQKRYNTNTNTNIYNRRTIGNYIKHFTTNTTDTKYWWRSPEKSSPWFIVEPVDFSFARFRLIFTSQVILVEVLVKSQPICLTNDCMRLCVRRWWFWSLGVWFTQNNLLAICVQNRKIVSRWTVS